MLIKGDVWEVEYREFKNDKGELVKLAQLQVLDPVTRDIFDFNLVGGQLDVLGDRKLQRDDRIEINAKDVRFKVREIHVIPKGGEKK